MARLRYISVLLATPPVLWPALFRERIGGGTAIPDFDDDHPCIFVLSTGRVGTETLAATCRLSRRMVSVHEPRPILYGLSRVAYELEGDESARAVEREAFVAARRVLFEHAKRRGRGYVETSPQATFLAPAIVESVPGVRFVHLMRDPRDVVRSGMRRAWYAGNRADPHRLRPRAGSPAAADWNDLSPLEKNIWLWTETNRWIADFLEPLEENRKLTLRAEDVFAADPLALRSLFALFADPPPAERKLRAVLGKRLNAQRTGTFPTYDDWRPAERDTLKRVAGATAARFGYEL